MTTTQGRDAVEARAVDAFVKSFGVPPDVVASAPGRVNLMGDHTDYCGGLVLPIAIGERTAVALGPSDRERCELESLEFGERVECPAPAAFRPREAESRGAWANLAMGPLRMLSEPSAPGGAVALPAIRAVIASDVPLGAGLSSSAALTVAMTAAALRLVDRHEHVGLRPLVELLRDAERRFAGTPCGIMDMTIALAAEPGAALLIDCGAFTIESVPVPDELAILLVDSGVRHRLAAGEYAERRREMEVAVSGRLRGGATSGAAAIAAAGAPSGAGRGASINDLVTRSARHFASENERVRAAAVALRRGELAALGALALESHASLRGELGVSVAEVDRVVDFVRERGVDRGAFGARMTGGGFGGSVVVFADRARLDEVRALLDDAVRRGIGVAHREARIGRRYTARREGDLR